MPVNLGELMLKEKMVTPQQLQDAERYQKQNGAKLGKALVTLGFVKDEEITSLLSRRCGVKAVNLDHYEVDPATLKVIPAKMARKYQILPLAVQGKTVLLAMADPTDVVAMDDIRFMTGCAVDPVVASESALEDSIDRYYGSMRSPSLKEVMDGPGLTVDDMASVGLSEVDLAGLADGVDVETVKTEQDEIDLGDLSKSADAAPIVKLTNVLLIDSVKRGASDIHIEPYENEFRVRFRIEGILYNVMALPMKLRDPLTSRIKTMARLKVAERNLPQRGRIRIKMRVGDRSREVDFRISCLPTLWGETIVLRLLDQSKLMLDMTQLGFEPHSLERFKNAIAKPYGVVLVTGPTGSGKTNTLYSALASLNRPDNNIVTAEDPVEFSLPGINQVQVRGSIGLTFPVVLRELLAQDASIVVVSEIRDREAAEMVFKLALDGRLVLSTVSANDTPSAVSFLLSLGMEPFTVATAVSLIQAQRLVRRVCPKCGMDDTADVPSKTLIDIGFVPDQIGSFRVMKGRGCGTCNGTGYKGRVGLFEVMEMSEGLGDLVKGGASAAEIKRKALEEGMLTLRMSGLEKIRNGVTTVDEVLRETVF